MSAPRDEPGTGKGAAKSGRVADQRFTESDTDGKPGLGLGLSIGIVAAAVFFWALSFFVGDESREGDER